MASNSYFAATRVASVSSAANFFLDGGKPGGVVGVAHHLDLDRHVGVAGAAQFGALAIEDAGLGRP